MRCPQIRTPGAGERLRFGLAPLGDLAVIARKQNLRDRAAAPLPDGCIAGVPVARSAPPRWRRSPARWAANARWHPAWPAPRSAPGQDKIAKADFFNVRLIQHPLIHPLEPSAKQGDTVGCGQRRAVFWVKGAPRGDAYTTGQRAIGGRTGGRNGKRPSHHVCAQHHASAATRRRVVHVAMLTRSHSSNGWICHFTLAEPCPLATGQACRKRPGNRVTIRAVQTRPTAALA